MSLRFGACSWLRASLFVLLSATASLATPAGVAAQRPSLPGETVEAAQRLMEAALESPVTWERLAELVDRFGPRFSGSESLESALDWILEGMKADGLENVRAEPVMVPRWIRGPESAELLAPRYDQLTVLGLGPSVPTPPGGIWAEVLVVESFAELEARAGEAR
ncbi:MAG TPA: hypothetical protein RMF84_12685, partial [Polyangiaceae bacterium LLY-WYZ-14_1]|nr:hypothetical protein [Polyangiaceae bacterium LLY-WYZ-14_1]